MKRLGVLGFDDDQGTRQPLGLGTLPRRRPAKGRFTLYHGLLKERAAGVGYKIAYKHQLWWSPWNSCRIPKRS